MDPNETSEPTCYNSSYEHGVDDKRRIQIPARWRPSKPGTEFTLVSWPASSEGRCLRVLPPKGLAKLMQDIEAIPNTDPSKVPLKRFVGHESVQVEMDKSGRICLPERMAKDAGIADKALLVGLLNQFEIWNPERFEKVREGDRAMVETVARMIG